MSRFRVGPRNGPKMSLQKMAGVEGSAKKCYGSVMSNRYESNTFQNFLSQSKLNIICAIVVASFVCLFALCASYRPPTSVLFGSTDFSMVDISAQQRIKSKIHSAADQLAAMSSQQIGPGHVLHIDMPMSQMDQLKIGSVVKGHLRLPMLASDEQHVGSEFNSVPFTGEVGSRLNFFFVRNGQARCGPVVKHSFFFFAG